jgi:hypothetical protein
MSGQHQSSNRTGFQLWISKRDTHFYVTNGVTKSCETLRLALCGCLWQFVPVFMARRVATKPGVTELCGMALLRRQRLTARLLPIANNISRISVIKFTDFNNNCYHFIYIFTIMHLKQTTSLGYILLQLFCSYNMWHM